MQIKFVYNNILSLQTNQCYFFSYYIFQASKKAGISDEIAKHALSKIKDDDVKNRLKKNTEEALKLGVSVVNPNRVNELGGFVQMFL